MNILNLVLLLSLFDIWASTILILFNDLLTHFIYSLKQLELSHLIEKKIFIQIKTVFLSVIIQGSSVYLAAILRQIDLKLVWNWNQSRPWTRKSKSSDLCEHGSWFICTRREPSNSCYTLSVHTAVWVEILLWR